MVCTVQKGYQNSCGGGEGRATDHKDVLCVCVLRRERIIDTCGPGLGNYLNPGVVCVKYFKYIRHRTVYNLVASQHMGVCACFAWGISCGQERDRTTVYFFPCPLPFRKLSFLGGRGGKGIGRYARLDLIEGWRCTPPLRFWVISCPIRSFFGGLWRWMWKW